MGLIAAKLSKSGCKRATNCCPHSGKVSLSSSHAADFSLCILNGGKLFNVLIRMGFELCKSTKLTKGQVGFGSASNFISSEVRDICYPIFGTECGGISILNSALLVLILITSTSNYHQHATWFAPCVTR